MCRCPPLGEPGHWGAGPSGQGYIGYQKYGSYSNYRGWSASLTSRQGPGLYSRINIIDDKTFQFQTKQKNRNKTIPCLAHGSSGRQRLLSYSVNELITKALLGQPNGVAKITYLSSTNIECPESHLHILIIYIIRY